MMRSVLVHIPDKLPVLKECYRVLKEGGRISIFEPVISKNTKYYELINPANFPNYQKIKEIEDQISSDKNDPLTNFDETTLENNFKEAGFKNVDVKMATESSTYPVDPNMIEPWFNTPPSPGKPALKEKFLQFMPEEDVKEFMERLKTELGGKEITINSPVAYIYAEK